MLHQFDHLTSLVIYPILPQQIISIEYFAESLKVKLKSKFLFISKRCLALQMKHTIQTARNDISLHISISKCKDSIMNIFLDIIGNLLHHPTQLLNMRVQCSIMLNRRHTQGFQDDKGHLPFLLLQRNKHQREKDLPDCFQMGKFKKFIDELEVEVRDKKYWFL